MAPHGVQVEGGPPPLPPAAEKGGEEGLHLGQVGVEEHVGAGHGGGEAAPTRAILVVVTLKRGSAWRVAAAAREDEGLQRYTSPAFGPRSRRESRCPNGL